MINSESARLRVDMTRANLTIISKRQEIRKAEHTDLSQTSDYILMIQAISCCISCVFESVVISSY